jgi:hypothetical protein
MTGRRQPPSRPGFFVSRAGLFVLVLLSFFGTLEFLGPKSPRVITGGPSVFRAEVFSAGGEAGRLARNNFKIENSGT